MTASRDCDSCTEPLDPVALPRHPSHDFTDADLVTIARLNAELRNRDQAELLEALREKARADRWQRARKNRRKRS